MGYEGERTVYLRRCNYANAVLVFGEAHADRYRSHWESFGYTGNRKGIFVQNGMGTLGRLKSSPVFRYGQDIVIEDKALHKDIVKREPGVLAGKHVRYGSRTADKADWSGIMKEHPTIYKDEKTGMLMGKGKKEIGFVDEKTGALRKIGGGANYLIALALGIIVVAWLLLMGRR